MQVISVHDVMKALGARYKMPRREKNRSNEPCAETAGLKMVFVCGCAWDEWCAAWPHGPPWGACLFMGDRIRQCANGFSSAKQIAYDEVVMSQLCTLPPLHPPDLCAGASCRNEQSPCVVRPFRVADWLQCHRCTILCGN